MFVGRKKELKKLNELYGSDNFECAVIYGRRRVGKTTLINEFIKDKDAIFFTALEINAKENLVNLSKCIMGYAIDNNNLPVFEGFQQAFDYVADLAMARRLVMVIDEYPYLAGSYRSVSSMLQAQIDHKFKSGKLMIILCGSSMSFMENQVLGYQSPLYGRRTAQLKIEPFSYFEVKEFYQHFSPEALAIVYGLTGGIPQYLEKISDKKSIEANIKDNFLDPSSYLFEEPANLLKQELRECGQYNAIIKAIAAGSSRLNEIATKAGIATALCSNYLSSLMALGLIKKEFPLGEEKSKKTIYRLQDNMFRFWYRFIPENISRIQQGMQDSVYGSIKLELSHYMGEVFETICQQYMWKENIAGHLPFEFDDIGRWWGSNAKQKREEEVDFIALAGNDRAIIGECKWSNEFVGRAVLDNLVERGSLFAYQEMYYFLFAKNGFTEACFAAARDNSKIRLITFSEMNQSGNSE
jgi:hypothetical protein